MFEKLALIGIGLIGSSIARATRLKGLAKTIAISTRRQETLDEARVLGLGDTYTLDPVAAGRRLANYLAVLTLEAQTIARACGKSHLHNLEPEDLVALTIEAAAMAQVPLAGTNWIPGKGGNP